MQTLKVILGIAWLLALLPICAFFTYAEIVMFVMGVWWWWVVMLLVTLSIASITYSIVRWVEN